MSGDLFHTALAMRIAGLLQASYLTLEQIRGVDVEKVRKAVRGDPGDLTISDLEALASAFGITLMSLLFGDRAGSLGEVDCVVPINNTY